MLVSPETLMTFAAATLLMALSPGPSNLYIMARSINHGHHSGIAAASGMAIGSLIFVFATAFGLAAIFHYSPMAYTTLKIGGALYLIYLGWQYFGNGSADQQLQKLAPSSFLSIFRQSILVELTNPKTALFFMAFLPQFVVVNKGSVIEQMLVLGAIYTIICLGCDLLVAIASGHLGRWLAKHPKFARWQDNLAGTILAALGSYILFTEIRLKDSSALQ